nr:FMN-binding protein [Clostridium polyendosporum]
MKAQSTNVDGISGATRSCNGIKEAVEDALSQAI